MANAERPVVEVRELQPDELPAVVALLARGFRDNPIPTALFGRDPERRRRCLETMFGGMFRVILVAEPPLVAFDGADHRRRGGHRAPWHLPAHECSAPQALSVHVAHWPRLHSSHRRACRRHGANLTRRSRTRTLVLSRLTPISEGEESAPRSFTPTVDASTRRRWPATWRPRPKDNVRLYTRFGFEVIAEQRVIGVPNWFMRRPSEGS